MFAIRESYTTGASVVVVAQLTVPFSTLSAKDTIVALDGVDADPEIMETPTMFETRHFTIDHNHLLHLSLDAVIAGDSPETYKVVYSVNIIHEMDAPGRADALRTNPESFPGTEPEMTAKGGKTWPGAWDACVHAHVTAVARRALYIQNAMDRPDTKYVRKRYTMHDGVGTDLGSFTAAVIAKTTDTDELSVPTDLDMSSMRGPMFMLSDVSFDKSKSRDGIIVFASVPAPPPEHQTMEPEMYMPWELNWEQRAFDGFADWPTFHA